MVPYHRQCLVGASVIGTCVYPFQRAAAVYDHTTVLHERSAGMPRFKPCGATFRQRVLGALARSRRDAVARMPFLSLASERRAPRSFAVLRITQGEHAFRLASVGRGRQRPSVSQAVRGAERVRRPTRCALMQERALIQRRHGSAAPSPSAIAARGLDLPRGRGEGRFGCGTSATRSWIVACVDTGVDPRLREHGVEIEDAEHLSGSER